MMETKFRISENDYVNALKLYGKLSPKMLIVYLSVAGGLILIAIFGSPLIRSGAIGGVIGGAIVAILGRYILSPMLARRHYRKYKAIHDEFSVGLNDDGVSIESSNAKGLIPWSNILKWRDNDDYVLIYLMPRLYHIVPKSVSHDGFDVDLLINSLNRNVGKSA